MPRPTSDLVLAASLASILILSACGGSDTATAPPAGTAGPGNRPQTAVVATGQLVPYTPVEEAAGTGVFLLPKACDVLIGRHPAAVAGGAEEFQHQLLVSVPAGSRVKLVDPADFPNVTFPPLPTGVSPDVITNKTFSCDPVDPNPDPVDVAANPAGTQFAVTDALTGLVAKGNGPAVNTRGVYFDLNGYSVTSPTDPDALQIPSRAAALSKRPLGATGVSATASGVVVLNSASAVSNVTNIGHAIFFVGPNDTLRGADMDPNTPGLQSSLFVEGVVVDARNSGGNTGNALVDKVKVVNNQVVNGLPAGHGVIARGCTIGLVTLTNSHLEGNAQGVEIRECNNIAIDGNVITSPTGQGIATRTDKNLFTIDANRRIVITNNQISNIAGTAIFIGARGTVTYNNGGLLIQGNTIDTYATITPGACGIGFSGVVAPGSTLPTDGTLLAQNTVAVITGVQQTCGFPAGPPPPTPPVIAPLSPASGVEGSPIAFAATATNPGGSPLTFSWDFGDGSPAASGATVSHAYGDNGGFTATVTATNAGGPATATAAVTVTNANPVVSIGAAGTTATAGQPYALPAGSFSDAGAADGPWSTTLDWGDGGAAVTASQATQGALAAATHTFAAAGTFTVTRSVKDKDGGVGSATVSVTVANAPANAPPVAKANGPYSGNEGAAITFSSAGSADPEGTALTYTWSFGDGGSSTVANPTHAYADNGSFTATLTVKDAAGLASTVSNATVTVTNAMPVVKLGVAATAIGVGKVYSLGAGSFTDAGEKDAPWTYVLDWGDGSLTTTTSLAARGALAAATHTFTRTGTFTVRRTVTDKDGGRGTASVAVVVSAVATGGAPIAKANGPYSGTRGTPVAFSSAGSTSPGGGVLTYHWTFGDGTHLDVANPTHAYSVAKTYSVTLTVKNASGVSSMVALTTATIR